MPLLHHRSPSPFAAPRHLSAPSTSLLPPASRAASSSAQAHASLALPLDSTASPAPRPPLSRRCSLSFPYLSSARERRCPRPCFHRPTSPSLLCSAPPLCTPRLALALHGSSPSPHIHTRPHYSSSQPPTTRPMAGKEESEPPTLGASSGDKLVLRGMQFHGFHGVKQEEKKLGQKFVVDVDAWMDLAAAGGSDDIADTVSYTDIYRIAKGVVEGPPHNLLESVAQSIANSTLLNFPQISAVRVKVEKPHVAVQGVLDYLGVEIVRYKKA